MRAILFYPLAALTAGAAIALSMNTTLIPRETAAQAGRLANGAYIFDAEALSRVDKPPTQEFFLVRGPGAKPTSIQIATPAGTPKPGSDAQGVRLLLAPSTGAAFAGKAVRVELRVRPLLYTTAPQILVRAEGAAPTRWVSQEFPHTVIEGAGDDARTSAWLQFDLPPSTGPIQAIGIWPYNNKDQSKDRFAYNAGVEILEARLSVAPQTASLN
jgi:hypothetical protein